MKRTILLTILLLAGQSLLFSLAAFQPEEPKQLDAGVIQNAGSLHLKLTNYGVLGEGYLANLIFPPNSGVNYLYKGSLWIGAKKYRRNAEGVQLYWLAQHPSADSSGTVAYGAPGWNSSLAPVVDTLTSVGFDGDADLYELLPAYNPLLSANPGAADLYAQYNLHDRVLKSILSHPMPREFAWPDPAGNYCFAYPQNVTGNEPAFETCSAFCYDICPFGTGGQRDWGAYRSYNEHIPLGLAIEQKSYAWPLQNHDRRVVFKYTLHNTSEADTLYDIAVSSYLDCDIGPVAYGATAASDDLSGYVMGPEYEFAYSRDNDLDGGAAPGYIGCKLILPGTAINYSSYYWKVGDGPDDFDPLSFSLGTHLTANEKYWLQTGRNPTPGSATKYLRLRGGPTGDTPEYLQPSPNDTRFLYSLFGNLPGPGNPHPAGRLNLAPGQAISFYLAIFADFSLESLKAQAQAVTSFISGGFDLGSLAGLTSMPYLTALEQTGDGTVRADWFSYTDPDHFELQCKPSEAPASQWQALSLAGNLRTGQVYGLTDLQSYKFKVASIFNPGPNEIYLESQTLELLIDDNNAAQEEAAPAVRLSNQPNPFGPGGTVIRFDPKLGRAGSLSVYNVRGQRVRTFSEDELLSSGGSLAWDGTNSAGRTPGSGVYFCVLKTQAGTFTNRMLLLR